MWVSVVWALAKAAVLGWGLLWLVRSTRPVGDRAFISILLAVAAVLGIAWLVLIRQAVVGDAAWYHERAVSLASGFGFTIDGAPTSLFPPVYPMLLALVYRTIGVRPWVAQLLNLGLTLASIALAWHLATRLFGRSVGRLSAAIVAFWPGRLPFVGLLASEALFTTLFCASFAVALRVPRAIRWPLAAAGSGVLLALAVLTRPVGLAWAGLLPLVFWIGGANVRRTALATGLAAIAVVVVMAPWAWRNTRVFGRFIPLTTSTGIVLRDGNHVGATGLPSDANDNPHRAIRDELLRDRLAREEALAFIRQNPADAFRLYWARLYRTYETDVEGVPSATEMGERGRALFLRICNSYFSTMLLLFAAFLVLPVVAQERQAWRSWLLVVLPVAYFALFQALFLAQYRYNYPPQPFIAMGAAVVLTRLSAVRVALTETNQPTHAFR